MGLCNCGGRLRGGKSSEEQKFERRRCCFGWKFCLWFSDEIDQRHGNNSNDGEDGNPDWDDDFAVDGKSFYHMMHYTEWMRLPVRRGEKFLESFSHSMCLAFCLTHLY
mgnify:CR=1 FL=1